MEFHELYTSPTGRAAYARPVTGTIPRDYARGIPKRSTTPFGGVFEAPGIPSTFGGFRRFSTGGPIGTPTGRLAMRMDSGMSLPEMEEVIREIYRTTPAEDGLPVLDLDAESCDGWDTQRIGGWRGGYDGSDHHRDSSAERISYSVYVPAVGAGRKSARLNGIRISALAAVGAWLCSDHLCLVGGVPALLVWGAEDAPIQQLLDRPSVRTGAVQGGDFEDGAPFPSPLIPQKGLHPDFVIRAKNAYCLFYREHVAALGRYVPRPPADVELEAPFRVEVDLGRKGPQPEQTVAYEVGGAFFEFGHPLPGKVAEDPQRPGLGSMRRCYHIRATPDVTVWVGIVGRRNIQVLRDGALVADWPADALDVAWPAELSATLLRILFPRCAAAHTEQV